MQTLSADAIRKPIPPVIVFVLLTFAGLLGFHKLGINQFPDVDIPIVTVRIGQPGAAPAELESQVTRVVENAVATVGDVSHIVLVGVRRQLVDVDRVPVRHRPRPRDQRRPRRRDPGPRRPAGRHRRAGDLAHDDLGRADDDLHGEGGRPQTPAS